MAGAKSAYLFLFNAVSCAGWAYVLYLTLTNLQHGGNTRQLWKDAEGPLKLAQTAALLEVLHSLLGVVRAPIMTTAMQVASRIWVLWGIVAAVPKQTTSQHVHLAQLGPVQLDLSLNTLLLAWSITEVIRYSFFALKELGLQPYPLLWLRYTTFIVLYPLGVASELSMVWLALPHIKRSHKWSIAMPNSLNFGFDYYICCLVLVACYLPGFPQLYIYMLRQRRKVLGTQRTKLH
jgi:very-long-chain (3R)-3-hydroxyacyl-CoA dehydratase